MTRRPTWLLVLLLPLATAGLVALSSRAQAQDASVLKPPQGASLALVVFQDLECPRCSRDHPLLQEAARTYKIPLVQYDFPLPGHSWAFDAAVITRYFDAQSKKLGEEYRDYIFQHQGEVTKDNLRSVSEKFAAEHHTALGFVVDPQGKFAAAVRADQELGERVGIRHTPTIYLVTNNRKGPPFVEVVDSSQLFQMIDSLKNE
jgi:protein-disulfide isomerase